MEMFFSKPCIVFDYFYLVNLCTVCALCGSPSYNTNGLLGNTPFDIISIGLCTYNIVLIDLTSYDCLYINTVKTGVFKSV